MHADDHHDPTKAWSLDTAIYAATAATETTKTLTPEEMQQISGGVQPQKSQFGPSFIAQLIHGLRGRRVTRQLAPRRAVPVGPVATEGLKQ
jgi:hypothetical protein